MHFGGHQQLEALQGIKPKSHYGLGHARCQHSLAAHKARKITTIKGVQNDYEDNYRHCSGLGNGSRPRVRADRHHDTARYDNAAEHYHHNASGYHHATGNNDHPSG